MSILQFCENAVQNVSKQQQQQQRQKQNFDFERQKQKEHDLERKKQKEHDFDRKKQKERDLIILETAFSASTRLLDTYIQRMAAGERGLLRVIVRKYAIAHCFQPLNDSLRDALRKASNEKVLHWLETFDTTKQLVVSIDDDRLVTPDDKKVIENSITNASSTNNDNGSGSGKIAQAQQKLESRLSHSSPRFYLIAHRQRINETE